MTQSGSWRDRCATRIDDDLLAVFESLDPVLAPADRLRVEEARYAVASEPLVQVADEVLVLAAVTEEDAIRMMRPGAILSHWRARTAALRCRTPNAPPSKKGGKLYKIEQF